MDKDIVTERASSISKSVRVTMYMRVNEIEKKLNKQNANYCVNEAGIGLKYM